MKVYGQATQCTDCVTNKTGSYLFDIEKGPTFASSPIFSDLAQLFDYIHKHNNIFRKLPSEMYFPRYEGPDELPLV